MAKKIRLNIVTPEKTIYTDDVNMIVARTTTGDIGILPRHAPLIAALAVWPLRIMTDDGEVKLSMCGGFIEVQPDKVTILSNCAELSQDIDVARAEIAKKRAEERLIAANDAIDVARAEAALQRAKSRLIVGNYHKK